jgi:hypothetical protein
MSIYIFFKIKIAKMLFILAGDAPLEMNLTFQDAGSDNLKGVKNLYDTIIFQ